LIQIQPSTLKHEDLLSQTLFWIIGFFVMLVCGFIGVKLMVLGASGD
jgi:hypothetical protein